VMKSASAARVKLRCCATSRNARNCRPPAQRAMSKRAGASMAEVKGSHAVYVSQPQAVAEIIKKAAKSLSAK
jgi:hypothetical protein